MKGFSKKERWEIFFRKILNKTTWVFFLDNSQVVNMFGGDRFLKGSLDY